MKEARYLLLPSTLILAEPKRHVLPAYNQNPMILIQVTNTRLIFRVSCEESCELFVENKESVSLCGWLQSQGYDTTDLLAQPLKYNLNIQSIASKRFNFVDLLQIVKPSSFNVPYKQPC